MRTKTILTLLKLVFFFSGFSSLIYQVAWQRILTLYYSVENISTTLIVTVYMLGLGIGAILGGVLAERIENRLRLYFFIELLIGLFGCISLPFLELVGMSTAGSNYFTSFIGMFLFLCMPTILMGMTLPLLTKIYHHHMQHFLNSISFLYFVNTIGAAAGCFFASYILISFWGLDISIYVAACLNLILALTVIFIARKPVDKHTGGASPVIKETVSDHPGPRLSPSMIYGIVFITGFIAIGYEIVWFRIIGAIVKASPYAFSSILAVYLTGIALGSLFMKRLLRKHPGINQKNLFFTLQFLIAAFVLVSIIGYYYLVQYVPFFSNINRASFSTMEHPFPHLPRTDSPAHFLKDLFVVLDVFIWPAAFIFIPTLLMGAGFPLINSLAFTGQKAGSTVGRIYFLNVLGNVAGGLTTGLFLLQSIGSERSLLLLSVIGLLFLAGVDRTWGILRGKYSRGILVGASILALIIFPGKHKLYSAIHPPVEYHPDERKIITEGLEGVIVTYSFENNLRTYINGMTHGGRPYMTFYYEAIETLSFNKNPENVLVIGFGTGSTVETIQKASPRSKIKLVELSPALIENLNNVDYIRSILQDDKLELIYADGRKYLYNSSEQFDAIFMDPLRTTTSFSNNLYSREFFQLIKNHLADSGVFMVWTDEHFVVPKTLSAVFPLVNKYSYFCVAANKPLLQDSAFKTELFGRFGAADRAELFKLDSGERTPLNREQILSYSTGFPVNRDYRPHCEFYLGFLAHRPR